MLTFKYNYEYTSRQCMHECLDCKASYSKCSQAGASYGGTARDGMWPFLARPWADNQLSYVNFFGGEKLVLLCLGFHSVAFQLTANRPSQEVYFCPPSFLITIFLSTLRHQSAEQVSSSLQSWSIWQMYPPSYTLLTVNAQQYCCHYMFHSKALGEGVGNTDQVQVRPAIRQLLFKDYRDTRE